MFNKIKKSLVIGLSFLTALNASAKEQERIISVGGDVTEIIFALGADNLLVARDLTSQLPAKAEKLPNIGHGKLNVEGILALKPTRMIFSSIFFPRGATLEQLKDAGIKMDTVPYETSNPMKVVDNIKTIGKIVGKERKAKLLARDYQRNLAKVKTSPLNIKVLYLYRHPGLSAAGNKSVPGGIIKYIGAKNALPNADTEREIKISQEGLIASDPDLVILPEGMGDFDTVLKSVPGLALTKAGKNRNYVMVNSISTRLFSISSPAEMLKIRQAAEKVSKAK